MPWEVRKRQATEQQSELQPAKMPKLQPTPPQGPPPDHLMKAGPPLKVGPVNQEEQRLAVVKKLKESLKPAPEQLQDRGYLKPGLQGKKVAQQLPERVEMKENEEQQEQQKPEVVKMKEIEEKHWRLWGK